MQKLIEFFRKHPFADAGAFLLFFRALDWLLTKAEHATFIAEHYPAALKMAQEVRAAFGVSDVILWVTVFLGLGLIIWDIYFRRHGASAVKIAPNEVPDEKPRLLYPKWKYRIDPHSSTFQSTLVGSAGADKDLGESWLDDPHAWGIKVVPYPAELMPNGTVRHLGTRADANGNFAYGPAPTAVGVCEAGIQERVPTTATSVATSNELYPDWPIQELFYHINPGLRSGVTSPAGTGSEIRDKLSLGQLKIFGRKKNRYGELLPLAEIASSYWQHEDFRCFFLAPDAETRALGHSGRDETELFDLQVNRAQAMRIWPQKSAPQRDGERIGRPPLGIPGDPMTELFGPKVDAIAMRVCSACKYADHGPFGHSAPLTCVKSVNAIEGHYVRCEEARDNPKFCNGGSWFEPR